MKFVKEYDLANDKKEGHSLQDDFLAALGVALMFSKYGD